MELHYLKSILHYDPESGQFTWLVTKSATAVKGSEAGAVKPDGYRLIRIDKKLYYAHRLAYFYMTGAWPEHEMDHINHLRDDNRWSNLRVATSSENKHNRKQKGVYLDKRRGTFYSSIVVNGERNYLGRFDTEEDGIEVYNARKRLASGLEEV